MPRPAFRALLGELRRARPDLEDPEQAVADGRVLVDGRYVTNPAARVRTGCALVVKAAAPLRGTAKLRAALDAFELSVAGAVALDAGASAGGFTEVLLAAGAAKVYAVDAGVGQLVGRLRQHPEVVNLEGTNVADLDRGLVPDALDVVTLDLSYLALADAVPQLTGALAFSPEASLVALVKPMFELRLADAPLDDASLERAIELAAAAAAGAGWTVEATMASPVTGAKGAREGFLHARRPRG